MLSVTEEWYHRKGCGVTKDHKPAGEMIEHGLSVPVCPVSAQKAAALSITSPAKVSRPASGQRARESGRGLLPSQLPR